MYVVDRDFGFAPNPFHGYCTLATCKYRIRNKAEVKDWVIGMGGSRLNATGRCIFAMRVTEKITFNEYWASPTFLDKKPVRNGSRKMMLGDNIYHRFDVVDNKWHQANSHHSNPDGSVNPYNLDKDTKSDKVLLSRHFFYFGTEAPVVPCDLLNAIEYKNGRNHRVFDCKIAARLIEWLHNSFRESLNQVIADPFDFSDSEKRYSASNNKVS
jgi:Nucleotide modification associated domain 2